MDKVDFRENNFDLIRIAAALQVAAVHARDHLHLESALPDLVWRLIEWFPGVPIFFVVSGFLIARAWENNPNLFDFAWNRALRVYPALWVCFVFSVATVYVSGYRPARVPPLELGGWILGQTTIVQFFNPSFLRGYGVGSLNGSLWSIPVELQFYAAVPFIYQILDLRRRQRLHALLAGLAIAAITSVACAWAIHRDPRLFATKLLGVSLIPYLYLFLFGAILNRCEPQLRPFLRQKAHLWLAAYLPLCVVGELAGATVGTNLSNPILALVLGTLTISAAFTAPRLANRILRGNDLSYGSYLYHGPLINLALHLGIRDEAWLLPATLVVTIGLAAISWRLVEAPALARKRRALRPLAIVPAAPTVRALDPR